MTDGPLSTDVHVKKSHAEITKGGSALRRYQDVIVGTRSLWSTLYYEFCMWLSPVPGAVGILLRQIFWRRLLGSCGGGVMFGVNILIRHPKRIRLGERVVIGDGCILDARNDQDAETIVIGADVILSNNVTIQCKAGTIAIGARCGIGLQSVIQSTSGCPVTIGNDVIIGPACYVLGGGNYRMNRLDMPIWQQGIITDRGVSIEDDVWLGANVKVLSGTTMGAGSVAAAGAVVNKDIPRRAICMGVPATPKKTRGEPVGEKRPVPA